MRVSAGGRDRATTRDGVVLSLRDRKLFDGGELARLRRSRTIPHRKLSIRSRDSLEQQLLCARRPPPFRVSPCLISPRTGISASAAVELARERRREWKLAVLALAQAVMEAILSPRLRAGIARARGESSTRGQSVAQIAMEPARGRRARGASGVYDDIPPQTLTCRSERCSCTRGLAAQLDTDDAVE